MKQQDVILTLTAVNTAILILGIVFAYRYYQAVAPQIAGLESTGSGLSGLFNLLTGKKPTTGATGG